MTKSSSGMNLNQLDQENGREFFEGQAGLDNPTGSSDLEAVFEVPVVVMAVLGQASLPVNQLLKLKNGDLIELNRRVGEAIEIFVNNRLIARGEVVLINGNLGVTMTEIVKVDNNE